MAKVTFAPLVTAVQGSIGGTTFQQNRSGWIARARQRPRKARTLTQKTSQSRLLVWLPVWRTLSLATQELWNDFALAHPHIDMWGRTRNVSGFNYFVRLNSQLVRALSEPITSPPIYEPPDPLTTVTINLHPGTLMVGWTPDPLPTNVTVIIYLSAPVWRSQTPYRQFIRFIFPVPYPISGPWDLHEPWAATFHTTYPPPNTDGMTIQALVYPVNVTNGLTNVGLLANAQLPPVP